MRLKKKEKETEEQARERRKKQYGCDGLCYGGMNDDGVVICQICGGVDTCEETRNMEAFATWVAVLTILFTPVILVAGIIFLVVATVKGWI